MMSSNEKATKMAEISERIEKWREEAAKAPKHDFWGSSVPVQKMSQADVDKKAKEIQETKTYRPSCSVSS